jgi:hypothetical protein
MHFTFCGSDYFLDSIIYISLIAINCIVVVAGSPTVLNYPQNGPELEELR